MQLGAGGHLQFRRLHRRIRTTGRGGGGQKCPDFARRQCMQGSHRYYSTNFPDNPDLGCLKTILFFQTNVSTATSFSDNIKGQNSLASPT